MDVPKGIKANLYFDMLVVLVGKTCLAQLSVGALLAMILNKDPTRIR